MRRVIPLMSALRGNCSDRATIQPWPRHSPAPVRGLFRRANRGYSPVMDQPLYQHEHEEFRSLCRTFLEREAIPHNAEWEKNGLVDREVWRKAGAAGLLGMDVGEEEGGAGPRDFRFNAGLVEELCRAPPTGPCLAPDNNQVAPDPAELTTHHHPKRRPA